MVTSLSPDVDEFYGFECKVGATAQTFWFVRFDVVQRHGCLIVSHCRFTRATIFLLTLVLIQSNLLPTKVLFFLF